MVRRGLAVFVFAAVLALAGSPDLEKAQRLFNRAQYEAVIQLLGSAGPSDAPAHIMVGKSWFAIGQFKKATEALEKAVAADPQSSEAYHWYGKAWGRRAETSNPLMAPGYAGKARSAFEKAVELNPRNSEAVNDLFEYYLEAPGFLGGGLQKAEALSAKIKANDPAEYHYAMARIAERRKDWNTAENHLRSAVNLAPRQVGRVIDLGRFLSNQGRTSESEEVFARAEKIAPDEPRLLFERASNLIRGKQNLDTAKALLQRYVKMPLSPDDPPRDEAYKLLKVAGA
jgi:tetratricopeptide (TPR) repeat protein